MVQRFNVIVNCLLWLTLSRFHIARGLLPTHLVTVFKPRVFVTGGSIPAVNKRSHLLFATTEASDTTAVAAPTVIMTVPTCSEETIARFQGKNVLLTGASSGLGRALALQLAQCGVKTLILSARKQPELEQVSTQCQEKASTSDVQVKIVLADLSDKSSVAKLAKEALEICPTGVDVLVNNGGVSSRSNFVDTSIEIDEKVMQINFLAGAALAKAVVPGMIQKGEGAVIWISSVCWLFRVERPIALPSMQYKVRLDKPASLYVYLVHGLM
jgi:hypothetical protein